MFYKLPDPRTVEPLVGGRLVTQRNTRDFLKCSAVGPSNHWVFFAPVRLQSIEICHFTAFFRARGRGLRKDNKKTFPNVERFTSTKSYQKKSP